jgi:DNA-binding response OmpR family regulator
MPNPKKYKILIVEDEAELLEMYKTKLEADGFEVYVASDGEAGFMIAKNSLPDLILLDILMPKVDGYTMLKKLKKDESTKDLSSVIFSNLSQKEEIEKGFKLGAKDYIIKTSITPGELVERVKEFLLKFKK